MIVYKSIPSLGPLCYFNIINHAVMKFLMMPGPRVHAFAFVRESLKFLPKWLSKITCMLETYKSKHLFLHLLASSIL